MKGRKRFSAKAKPSNAIMHQYEKVTDITSDAALNYINNESAILKERSMARTCYANYKPEFILLFPDGAYIKIRKKLFNELSEIIINPKN